MKLLILTLSLIAVCSSSAPQPQHGINQGVIIADQLDYPCAGDEKLWCWTCNEPSMEMCQNKGHYEHCINTESGTRPMCQREVDTDGDGQVVKIKSFCQPNVPTNPQQAPCMHTRGKEQCQLYLGNVRCKVCSYADEDSTPPDIFPLSACGLEHPSNPCDAFDEFNEHEMCRRSVDVEVPKQSPLVERMKRQEPIHAPNQQQKEPTSLWCWECKHSRNDERCWAEGRHTKCADKLGADVDAICAKDIKTSAEGRTAITRRCARRDRADPRAMGLGNGHCSAGPEGSTVCTSYSFGDPNDAAILGGSSVYRCKAVNHMDCVCRGDPHCFSLAGTPLSLSGDCEYLFSRDRCFMGAPENQDPRYKVTATMTTNPAGTRSWVTSVTLTIPPRNQVITIGQRREVTYNGLFLTPDQMPFMTDDEEGKLIIANGTQFVHVYSLDPPVHVLYNGQRSMQINIPSWMSGAGDHQAPSELCGVCGPGLDEERDEVLGHNPMQCEHVGEAGQRASSMEELLRSWTTGITEDARCEAECGTE